MAGTIQGDSAVRLATMVVPVAMYFLILGVLNSRRRPQLLSARTDFLLLLGALSPLCIYPAMQLAGASWMLVVSVAAIVVTGACYVILPAGGWVIYNLPSPEARGIIAQVLASIAGEVTATPRGFRLPDKAVEVDIAGFSLLRNTTISLRGQDRQFSRAFEQALAERLEARPVEGSAMATALLLVATGMLAAPLSLMAHRAVQIVRLLGDLLQ